MQHQPLQFGHLLELDRVDRAEVMQGAEHPADGVAELPIGLDRVLQDFRADALVVGVVAGCDPQAQDIGAAFLDHGLRLDGVAKRLRHLAAVFGLGEAVGQHDVIGRAAPCTAALQ